VTIAAAALAPRPRPEDDAGCDRKHVLGRAADLDAAKVVRVIRPESRRPQCFREIRRDGFVRQRPASRRSAIRAQHRPAKLGPDRIAGDGAGAASAMISVMNFRVPRSMPLAQEITGVPTRSDGAMDDASKRNDCAGTAARIASVFNASASDDVTVIRLSIATPGNKGFAREAVIACAAFASRDPHTTSRPARSAACAQRVPQLPAPSNRDALEGHSIVR